MENKLLEIYSDGAARGNPGEASWAYVFSVDGTIMEKYSGYIGISTNNIAEYLAVINSLIAASRSGYQLVRLFSDSELVIKRRIPCQKGTPDPPQGKSRENTQEFQRYHISLRST
jgi:ribonuclease HI